MQTYGRLRTFILDLKALMGRIIPEAGMGQTIVTECAMSIRGMASMTQRDLGAGREQGGLSTIFSTLTAKQHEVFVLIAESRSSKEIAWRLGVSESAVIQRIEAVRSRAGSPTRAELARAYRAYLTDTAAVREPGALEAINANCGHGPEVGPDQPSSSPVLVGLRGNDGVATSSQLSTGLIVPAAFLGPNATLNRVAAMVAIAAGLLTVAMMGLSVVQALAVML